jgi:LuxR family maltose regulon positive regulatory protein
MEQQPLLLTKLHIPPVRPELVSRPRLLERLEAGLDRKLTLVSAPAGFGKTTLLSEWTHTVEAHGHAPHHAPPAARPRVAWLSLDQSGNELARALACIFSAPSESHPQITLSGDDTNTTLRL